MLADPRHSCIVLLNITRVGRLDANASARAQGESLALLSACREVFGIPQIAIGEYERDLLPDHIAASVERLDVDPLALWWDPQLAGRLTELGTGVLFLGGAFLEEEVLIAALEGVRHGYDIRLVPDLSLARDKRDRSIALARLAHHGVLSTTLRQALLEWAVSLGDQEVRRTVRELLA
ncbi:Isochorismatase family protein [Bradyrhizobium yuanmingense]|uniref:Isochorismatase family protein n=1 Tax=Bradyrhizobium yuanmingense TaxID=108015 RepID=A0A1C3VKF9_9BRAD|nr:isochorismatase family protein [Bradyrhizobium yuanmingense]TWI28528.1 isochorismatase family protein [Bradyrhizobium yuanmingense]SCB28105.1 Isochorismatase family protein [Bradyrhizobium yuanmingense]